MDNDKMTAGDVMGYLSTLPFQFPDDYNLEYTDLGNGEKRLVITPKFGRFDAIVDLSAYKEEFEKEWKCPAP